MPGLKVLRQRIDSVGATRKITRAMQMVAASKLKRAQETIFAARPYAQSMHKTVSALATQTEKGLLSEKTRRFFDETQPVRNHLLIVITSQRGLCGGFNTQIIRLAEAEARKIQQEGESAQIICVGKKAEDILKRLWGDQIIQTYALEEDPLLLARAIAHQVEALFKERKCDRCMMFYSRFHSVLNQEPTAYRLVPIEKISGESPDELMGAIYSYEPDEAQMLDQLLPAHLTAQLFRGLLENAAGEQGARMTAMDSATRNAEEMLSDLSLTYNRTRQAVITRELVEIISGAEAL